MSDQGIITALGHPLRARILAELDEHEASPKELSQALGEKLGNVSYHVRILAGLDLIELVRQTPRRGAVEHHYRARPRPGAMVNLELDLDEAGWKAASEALDKFSKQLTKISKQSQGSVKGRIVAAVLEPPQS